MMSGPPRVYVIILNWNGYEDTRNCLTSLQRASYSDLRTIVVDNGSRDHSGERLKREFGDSEFIFNDKNLGFSGGCNVGIRAALEDDECGYVLLLNNDARVSPDFLHHAVEHAESDRQIGIVGGKILHSPQTRILSYAGGFVSRWRGQTSIRGFGEVDEGKYDVSCEVGFVIGALMLVKRTVFETAGLLPEEYFFGVEDLDYSLTVRRRGFKLYYVPQFVAYHVGDGSHWALSPKYTYSSYRGKLILLQKHLPWGLFPLWKVLLASYARTIAKRRWEKLANRFRYDQEKKACYEDMQFALLKAIQDHGTDDLSEETLVRFETALQRSKEASC